MNVPCQNEIGSSSSVGQRGEGIRRRSGRNAGGIPSTGTEHGVVRTICVCKSRALIRPTAAILCPLAFGFAQHQAMHHDRGRKTLDDDDGCKGTARGERGRLMADMRGTEVAGIHSLLLTTRLCVVRNLSAHRRLTNTSKDFVTEIRYQVRGPASGQAWLFVHKRPCCGKGLDRRVLYGSTIRLSLAYQPSPLTRYYTASRRRCIPASDAPRVCCVRSFLVVPQTTPSLSRCMTRVSAPSGSDRKSS